jgi:hypothetical protein
VPFFGASVSSRSSSAGLWYGSPRSTQTAAGAQDPQSRCPVVPTGARRVGFEPCLFRATDELTETSPARRPGRSSRRKPETTPARGVSPGIFHPARDPLTRICPVRSRARRAFRRLGIVSAVLTVFRGAVMPERRSGGRMLGGENAMIAVAVLLVSLCRSRVRVGDGSC